MKVLFIISYINAASWEMYYAEGIACMSASIKENTDHETDLYIIEAKEDFPRLNKYIADTSPDIIAFSSTAIQYLGVSWLAKKIRSKYPKLKLVVGGVHCTLNPHKVIKELSFNAVCVGEGEYVFKEYIQALAEKRDETKTPGMWIRKGEKIYRNANLGTVSLEDLPLPDRGLFARKGYDAYIGPIWARPGLRGGAFMMSRGCLFNCHYCASPSLNKVLGHSYYRVLSPRKGIDQIKDSLKKYNYDYITFVDDTFLLNKKWFFEFIDLYTKEIGIPFNCQTRAETVDKMSADALKKAGCYLVNMGVESGDENLRHKILNKRIPDRVIVQAANILHKANIQINSYNMMGLPEETPQLFRKTLEINARAQIDNPYIFIFFPYDGTQLYTYCKKHGLIGDKVTKGFVEREDTILSMPQFNREEILYYFRYAKKMFFYLKPWPGKPINRLKFNILYYIPRALRLIPSRNLRNYIYSFFGVPIKKEAKQVNNSWLRKW